MKPAAASPSEGLSRAALWASWNSLRGDAYELDGVERFVASGADGIRCDPSSMVRYPGDLVRYSGALTVSPAFRERLKRFEQVVSETAQAIYGRAPHRIRHYGAYNCRTTRNRAHRLSEHALGNAIDVIGFDFAAARKTQPVKPDLPKPLRAAFQVRIARHWEAPEGACSEASARCTKAQVARLHAQFLRELTDRLNERRDIFRCMLGPSHPSHADHLHLDVSPWRYVRL